MEESVTYQAIIARGRVLAAKRILLRQGRILFGTPAPEVEAAIQATTDLDRLERMLDRILTAASWDGLLVTP